MRIGACLGVLRPPSPPIWRTSFEGWVWTLFWTPFWTTFWRLLEVILGSLLGPKRRQKVDLFFERLLLGLRSNFRRLLGRLGALLGRLVFPKCCKKQYETAIFKIVLFRSRSPLGWLLEGILVHFGEVLGSKMSTKIAQKVIRNWTKQIYRTCTNFGHQNGAVPGTLFSYFSGSQPKPAPTRP